MKHRHRKKPGLPPGTLVYTGNKTQTEPNVSVLQYNEQDIHQPVFNRNQLLPCFPGHINWFDVRGIHEIDLIASLGKHFNIHALAQEDIVNTHQRPKFEVYDNSFFIVLNALELNKEQELISEQIAIYSTHNLVISFQEDQSDDFASIRERLFTASGRIRLRGADYLVYALIDILVDHYYTILDAFEDETDSLEEAIYQNPNSFTRERIHELKGQTLRMRKAVIPLRDAVARFASGDYPHADPQNALFIRDLHDHILQIIETLDIHRETLLNIQELYVSEVGLKMNNVMKVLTMISTIFIPLSFLAGVYGMNFKYMPELGYKYSYPIFWGVILVVVSVLVYWFRRKKWL